MRKTPLDIGDLCRRWIHSHEEDSDTELVYRPVDFAFPPARGRTGFEFFPNKSCIRVGVAAADGSKVVDGTWELEEEESEETLRIRIDCKDTSEVLTVASIDEERLIIRRDT